MRTLGLGDRNWLIAFVVGGALGVPVAIGRTHLVAQSIIAGAFIFEDGVV